MTSKQRLKELVEDFRKWLAANYSREEIEEDRVDSPSYNDWKTIEDYFAYLIGADELKNLDEEDRINLLYLIGRNWDIGTMLSWLSTDATLSHCGNLKESDFISLAHVVKNQHALEFQDAKSQIVVLFQKFAYLSDEIKMILLHIYETGDEYCKRLSMRTLGKLGYVHIRSLVERSWREQDYEHHRMACLSVIDECIKDDRLMNEYLKIADLDRRPYISNYVQELRQNKNYR
jgi:hypothetical protein